MPSSIYNTNVASLISQHQLTLNSKKVQTSMERLSSGFKINRAADDAAGLAISNNLVSQVGRLNKALQNTQDGMSSLQVADGTLQVINESLQRVRELTVQSGNDSYSTTMRDSIEAEVSSILKDIDRMASACQFNGINLLDGTATNAILQIGITSNANSTLNISSSLTAAGTGDAGGPGGLGLLGGGVTFSSINAIGVNGLTSANSRLFLADIDAALQKLNLQRGRIGAYENQLDNVSQNLMSSTENISNANSRIRDTDVASETAILAQNQVLQSAAVTVLGQTNQLPQMILQLLQGRS